MEIIRRYNNIAAREGRILFILLILFTSLVKSLRNEKYVYKVLNSNYNHKSVRAFKRNMEYERGNNRI